MLIRYAGVLKAQLRSAPGGDVGGITSVAEGGYSESSAERTRTDSRPGPVEAYGNKRQRLRRDLQFGSQVLHASVTLDAVAVAAQQLQVFDVILPALVAGDDVIDSQISQFKVGRTAGAVAFLFSVELPFVRGTVVWRQSTEVGALWYI